MPPLADKLGTHRSHYDLRNDNASIVHDMLYDVYLFGALYSRDFISHRFTAPAHS